MREARVEPLSLSIQHLASFNLYSLVWRYLIASRSI